MNFDFIEFESQTLLLIIEIFDNENEWKLKWYKGGDPFALIWINLNRYIIWEKFKLYG